MAAYKKEKMTKILGFLVLTIVLTMVLVSCKSEKKSEVAAEEKFETRAEEKAEAKAISNEEFYSIFGEAKEGTSGIFNIDPTPDGILISYQLYPVVVEEIDKEIGAELALKIKDLYDSNKNIDRTTFVVYTPESGEYGPMKKHVSFDLTRRIVQEIDWSTRTFEADFFKTVQNVRFY